MIFDASIIYAIMLALLLRFWCSVTYELSTLSQSLTLQGRGTKVQRVTSAA